MSDLVKSLEQLSPEKRELFELLLKEKQQKKAAGAPAIPRREAGLETLPVSFGQQRLWFLDQWEPGNPAYNLLQAVRLSGRLDATALQKCLNRIVERHESLRTTFGAIQGRPVQRIAPSLSLDLPLIDLRALPSAEQELRIRQQAVEAARQPFDLAEGPLLRALLLRSSEQEHVLLLAMHHIVSDGWSNGVLFQEMATLYAAAVAGRPAPLPELPIQYADFAIWQRGWLQGELLESQLSYWSRQLAGAPPVLDLPTDRPRPATLTFDGARHYLALPAGLTGELKALSQREGASLFMTMLAAFKTLLYAYTQQEDMLVGSPIANRNRAELEGLIGFFVNTLIMRTDLSGQPSFRELLRRVREVALGAYAHQDLPFEKLVEELQLERNQSHSPLFQVVFVLQNAPMPAVELSGMTLSPLEIDSGTTQFDLMLELYESAGELRGSFQYNTALFDAATIARMAGHLQTLLEGIVANPDRRLGELPLLSEAERRQILRDWNATEREYRRDICIHQLFEAQAERSPGSIATIFGEQSLSYGQLNRQANQLAWRLKSLGVGPGTLVAVHMHRSLEMVTALLGILKAGGAYVPVETSFPPARMRWVLESLKIGHVLTQHAHLATFDDLGDDLPELSHVLCLDQPPAAQEASPNRRYQRAGPAELAGLPVENPAPSAGPDDLAYIIFTSGSTGTPKGVVVKHKPVINLIEWVNRSYELGPADRVLFITSLSFDLSVYDIFGLLAAGGSIQIASDEAVREPEQLLRLLYEQPITFWDSAPAALQQLVPFLPSAAAPAQPGQLRLVFLSGDWIPVSLPDRIRSCFSGAQMISLGGATEATVWSNYHPIGRVDPAWLSIPYGKPIQNAQYYILDAQLNPSPIGVPGDLYIGGECLASGYANDPILTSEKFIPDPFRSEPGAMLYKTGDRARFWPDGTMEFLGRLDHQVKIRGFRVELGEIETVLAQHPGVREAAVQAHASDRLGREKYLVAYVTHRPGSAPGTAELRAYLQERLPEYMVPSSVVVLEQLPVTANGKLDRKALPVPDRGRLESETLYVTPRNSIEDTIAGIWTEVLEIERTGVYDSFFELGGHSLLATQVIARIQQTFQVDLSLRALFDGPTVASLASKVEAARAASRGMQVPPIAPADHTQDLPLSLAQERLWLIDQLVPGNTAYTSTGATRIKGPLDVPLLERCFNEVVRRHAILRTEFGAVKGQPVQRLREPSPFSILQVDLRQLPPQEREPAATRVAIEQAQQPFDLSRRPLMRITLIRLDEQEYMLALATHHIIYDLMSIGIYLREMRALYEAYAQGLPSPLPELPVQYADFADWQQRWMQREIMETQLPYWRQQLGGAKMVLELPGDRRRPPMQSFRGDRYGMGLSLPLTKSLKALSHQEGVTLFMTLLAAYNVLLYRYTDQTDIIVGSPIANRTRPELEGVIGFFVNILALRSDLSGNPSFRELLGRVREVALGAYMHQDLPFARLVEELQPQRDLSRNPIFQVMFNFLHNYMMPVPPLKDLSLELLRIHAETEQFDLSLDFWERPEGLQGSFDYNTDLFDQSTIARMAEQLIMLLEDIAANPDKPIAELALIGADERQRLLSAGAASTELALEQLCVHQRFEQQAERTPEAPALVYQGQTLSYRELNRRANQLAHHLRGLGVGPEVVVGICMERTPELLVGLLGILKAGGAYLPLDPLYPQERLAFMLQDAQAAVLVTQTGVDEGLPASGARRVLIDADWQAIARNGDDNPESGVADGNLAYIIYTSGSTGKPKGAMIEHAALASYTRTASARYALQPADRVLQFASISFDASAEEIFPCLAQGATLVLRDDAMLASAATFLERCHDWNVTVLDLPTAYWHELVLGLRDEQLALPPALRLVIIGGERALPERLQSWQRLSAGHPVQLVNTYGPTEATIVATLHELPSQPAGEGALREVPIGRPLEHIQVAILDRYLQPVPTGVPGELHIGGVALARGYLSRPELTAEKFIPNPYGADAGTRLYKTGDLARYRDDGTIEYMGRVDQQVKIRGFRVELGEIAAALEQHPQVQEGLVVAREESSGQQRLVAYVVPKAGQAPGAGELHAFIKQHLPAYMVPAAFVTLAALPRTPNGKLDQRALPAPDHARPELGRAFVAPRTPVETVLAVMWAELLEISEVGVHDHFFELGGHSLLATQLISQVRELFGVELSLYRLFQEPTVAGVVEALVELSGSPERVEKTAELLLQLAQVSDDDLEMIGEKGIA